MGVDRSVWTVVHGLAVGGALPAMQDAALQQYTRCEYDEQARLVCISRLTVAVLDRKEK